MSLYQPFLHIFLAVNRRLEMAGTQRDSLLSVETSQILGLVAIRSEAQAPITAHEMSRLLRIEKSVLSRKLAALQRRDLLMQVPSGHDKRLKTLTITAMGKRTLRADDIKRDRQFTIFAAHLTERDRRSLTELLKIVADNLHIPVVSARSRDPLRVEFFRLIRALGFLSSANLFDTGLPREVIQLLSILQHHRGEIPVELLKKILPYDESKISRLIHGYEAKGWLTITADSVDKRRKMVALSTRGHHEVEEFERRADPLFERALGPLRYERRERLQRLLEKLLIEASLSVRMAAKVRIEEIKSSEGMASVRAFALRMIVERKFESEAPAVIIHPEHRTYAAFLEGTLVGLVEWTTTSQGVSIENMLVQRIALAADIARKLLDAVTEIIDPSSGVSITAPYLRDILAAERRRELLSPFSPSLLKILGKVISQDVYV